MRYLLLCFFLLTGSFLSAQNAKMDSLKKVIATTKSDTVKGRAMCRLCGHFDVAGNVDEALKQGTNGLQIVKKANDKTGQAICYFKLGDIYHFTIRDYERAIQYYDSALIRFTSSNDFYFVCIAQQSLGQVFYAQGSFKKAIIHFNEALKIAQAHNLKKYIIEAHRYMGIVYEKQSNYSEAIKNYGLALRNAERFGDSVGVLNIVNGMGAVYFFLGDYPRALQYFLRGLNGAQKMDHKAQIITALNNVGNIYFYSNNYPQALDYYRQSLQLAEEIDNPSSKALAYNSLAGVFSEQKNYTEALKYSLKSLAIKRQLNDRVDISSSLGNIGTLYSKTKQPDSALKAFQEAYEIAESLGDREGIATIKINLGQLYFPRLNQPHNAKKEFLTALKIAQEIHHIEYISKSAEYLAMVDSALGDYQSAYLHYKIHTQYKDSLFNEDKAKEFGRIESKFQFEKEAEEAKRKQEEQAKIEAEATERRNNLQYLTIFAGIIGLFGGLVFMGKFRIPTRVLDVAVFAGLLILFEFLLILFDPWLDDFSGGIPFYKLGFNTLVAFGFAPLHGFLEGKLKKRLVKNAQKDKKG